MKFLQKQNYYRPLKNWPHHPYYRPQKSRNRWKNSKGTRNNKEKISNSFWKKIKIRDFFDFACPSITHPSITHPSPIHPSIQTGPEAWYPGAGIFGYIWGRITTSQEKSNKSQIRNQINLRRFWLLAFGSRLSAFGLPINQKIFHLTNFLKVQVKKWG